MEPSAQQLLNRKIGALGFTPTNNSAATGNSSLSVLGYKDNPDGTTSNYLSNGQIDTGTLTKNANNTATFTPTISLDTLQNPQTPLQVPQMQQTPVSTLNLQPYIDQAKQYFQPNPQEAQLADVYKTLFNVQSEGGRAQARAAAGEVAGLPEKQKAYQSALNKLTALQAEADTLDQRLQASVEGRGVTEGGLRPIATAQQRDLAVRQRFAAADALVAQGDYTAAKDQADQAVEDKFADRTDRMNALVNYGQYLSQQIERGELRADKTMQRAIEAQTRDYERQQRELEAEKQTRKDIAQIMLTARQYGADDATVKRIQSAGTFEDAIALAGSSIKDPKLELQLAQMRLDMANTRDQIRSRQLADQLSQATGTELPPDAFLGMSDDALKSNVVENVSKLKLTEAQGKAVTFAMRMISANKKINALVGEGKETKGDYDPTTLLAVGGRLVGSTGANTLDTNLRDFIGAALRFESGAAIPESEFESGNRIYSPAKLTITDKEISQYTNRRADAINAMISATGPAGKYIKQYYDETGNGLRTSSAEKDEINALFQQDDFNPNDY